MFGPAYSREMTLEIFLRYLEEGIQKINKVREKLYFIPDKEFAVIMKKAVERNLISINKENKTIFMSRKVKQVINFIEKFNFFEEIEKKIDNESYELEKEFSGILETVKFFELSTNFQSKLINCINYYYKIKNYEKDAQLFVEDYSSEVINFQFGMYLEKKQKWREKDE